MRLPTLCQPHLHTGLGIRRLKHNYFECRVGRDLRMVFKLDGSVLTMTRIGNHEDVRRFIKGTAQVADELGTARRTLERRFQTETGKTLHEFLTEIRLRRANRTLRQLDTPLGEIARESGYSALSAFIRMFKQSTGLHPRDYRRAHVKR